jgi:hypothetical protein
MKLSARSAAMTTAALAGMLMLSACGKQDQGNSNGPGVPPPPGTAQQSQPAVPGTSAPASAGSAAKPASAGTAAAAAAPAPAASPAPAAPADTVQVTTVVLGDAVGADHKVSKPKSSFAPTEKAIYASVATEGNTPGATLGAKWSYLEGTSPTVITDISQSVSTDGPATTTFKIQNPNQWPEGKYKVDISLNGKQVSSQDFEIKKR